MSIEQVIKTTDGIGAFSPLPLVVYPNELLRTKCVIVEEEEFKTMELETIIGRMIASIKKHSGLGLAAPQVGYNKRIIVMNLDKLYVWINPGIVFESNEKIEISESCLSLPGYEAKIKRPQELRVVYRDPEGNHLDAIVEGFHAIVVRHEIDHLDGTLFIDHLSKLKQTRALPKIRKFIKQHPLYGKG